MTTSVNRRERRARRRADRRGAAIQRAAAPRRDARKSTNEDVLQAVSRAAERLRAFAAETMAEGCDLSDPRRRAALRAVLVACLRVANIPATVPRLLRIEARLAESPPQAAPFARILSSIVFDLRDEASAHAATPASSPRPGEVLPFERRP